MTLPPDDASNIRDRLRRDLPAAIKARDTVAVAALRSALAAIDNTEAVEWDAVVSRPVDSEAEVAGAVAGVGGGEVARRSLTAADMEETVRAEVVERQVVARIYEDAGQLDQAERLRREARLLSSYLDGPEPPAN